MEFSLTEELIFGAQPGFLTLSALKSQELVAQQPLDQHYSVDNQPFARGKFAAVKRCRRLDSGREFAAKVIRKRRRGSGLSAETLHEAAVLDICRSCPHIVRLDQVYDAPTESVLVLELAEGGELQSILDRDEIPEEHHVIRFLRQVLSGLAFLHQRDIAHLDLKPQNLLLTGSFPDCDIKLCDFGIARHIARGADVREILGTPDYVAPEVLNYEPISLATDMWSVGVLAYVLLTGCTPFGGDTKQETFCNITRCQLDFPEDIFDNVSPAAIQFISSLLVKDPAGRLTAAQCLDHPWLSCGSSVDSIPAIMSLSDESCAFSSSSTIVPEDGDIHDDDEVEDIDPAVTSTTSDTTDTTATTVVEPSSKFFLDDTLMIPLPFANMSLSRRTASLPIRWRCPAKRDPAYDRASDLGYGSDGISEVSSVDSSSDRSSIISLDDSPQEYAVMRRYSDTSLSGERLWRRAWERFLPASAGTFVSPPHLVYRTQGPKSEIIIRGAAAGRLVNNKPWEKVCNGSLARAMERFKAPSSSTACLSAAVRTSPKVSEVRSKLLQASPASPKTSPQKTTPILHREKTDIVRARLSQFQVNSTP